MRERVIETNDGIQEELTVEVFDQFARRMRDKGWNSVGTIIKSGILSGDVLEIGPGPGYVGLEWLKQSENSKLTGCEISKSMITMATKNAIEYGFEKRVTYVEGNAMCMPFAASSFDAVFSNGSLHEWEDPVQVFNEIYRVLKPGGYYCVSDMRRDVGAFKKWMIYFQTKPKAIRPGFLTSLYAAYTVSELDDIIKKTKLVNVNIQNDFFGLYLHGRKTNEKF